jgi:NPCBM/NEW2 domain
MKSPKRSRRAAILGFLKTIPGLLTALGTLLAAVAGLLTALAQVGVVQVRSPVVLNPTTTTVNAAGTTTDATGPAGLDVPTTVVAAGSLNGGLVTVYLDQLEGLSESPETGSREIGGATYPHALAANVDGCNGGETSRRFDYDLGRHYRQFVTSLGVDNKVPDAGAQMQFEVFVDGVRRSSVVKGIGNATRVQLDVNGALRLTIVATLVHPIRSDCNGLADWGDPQLLGLPSEVPPSTSP